MMQAHFRRKPLAAFMQTAAFLALAAGSLQVSAGELYKLRQVPLTSFGGEMAASTDNTGFFGTAVFTQLKISHITDANGDDAVLPARVVPLPTGTPTGGAIPNGAYSSVYSTAPVDFSQTQSQINLQGGYITESLFNGGRFLFSAIVPLIKASRSFTVVSPAGTITPVPAAALPATAKGAIVQIAAAVDAQVKAGVAAQAATQNLDVSGLGDTELTVAWSHQKDGLKVIPGLSVFVPTGSYDKNRGPNPGYGNFYTVRAGVAVTYNFNPKHTDSSWDAGVTVGGRFGYSINTVNKDTDYKSGNVINAELAVMKVTGDWAFGSSFLAIQQVTDDTGTGAPADGSRYKNLSVGPFISYKLPGQDAGFNLSYNRNYGSRNAMNLQAFQLRFIRAW